MAEHLGRFVQTLDIGERWIDKSDNEAVWVIGLDTTVDSDGELDIVSIRCKNGARKSMRWRVFVENYFYFPSTEV